MLQDIRTSPGDWEAKAVLSKSRDYTASNALLPELQKSGLVTRRIETRDLAPELGFLRSKSTLSADSVRNGILGFDYL
jgi:hypothetical protein